MAALNTTADCRRLTGKICCGIVVRKAETIDFSFQLSFCFQARDTRQIKRNETPVVSAPGRLGSIEDAFDQCCVHPVRRKISYGILEHFWDTSIVVWSNNR
jgi:hypothetical protein